MILGKDEDSKLSGTGVAVKGIKAYVADTGIDVLDKEEFKP